MSDDFYIGYRKTMSPMLARFIRIAVIVVVAIVISVAAVIGALQEPSGDGTYNFGAADWFMAQIPENASEPALIQAESQQKYMPALLVSRGKHGPADIVAAMKHHIVRFKGARIVRGDVQAIEIGAESDIQSIELATQPIARTLVQPNATLEGELIDTKCYLGVMKPGYGKVHRGCASLCLRGGVPAGLVVRDADGNTRVIALNTSAPDAPAVDPEWAGRIVRVTGSLENLMGLPVLNVRELSLR